jgi:hypothetical protein
MKRVFLHDRIGIQQQDHLPGRGSDTLVHCRSKTPVLMILNEYHLWIPIMYHPTGVVGGIVIDKNYF